MGNTPPKKNRLQELKEEYDATINDKIALLEKLTKATQENPEELESLKGEIHKMSGSAGAFGYEKVSEVCKEIENEMNVRIEKGTTKDPVWISSLGEYINKIKEGYKTSSGNAEILKYKNKKI